MLSLPTLIFKVCVLKRLLRESDSFKPSEPLLRSNEMLKLKAMIWKETWIVLQEKQRPL